MDFGILLKYPNVRRISEKAADLAMLCRPLTFFGAFVGGASLDLLFSKLQFGTFDILHMFLIGLMMAFFQAGGQAFNQSNKEEIMIDRLNGKDYRPTVSGRLSLREAKFISILFFIVAISLSFAFRFECGILSLVMTFFAVGYTAPPLRVKRFLLLNNFWQGIARGFLPPLFVSLMYPSYIGLALAFGVFFCIWVSSAQTTKDFGDVIGDRRFQIKTLPAALGHRLSITVMTVGLCYAFLVLNLMVFVGLLPWVFIWLNILAIPSGLIVVFLKKGLSVNFTENNLAWVLFYITLASFYLLPALIV